MGEMVAFKQNAGKYDRIARTLVGLALVGVAYYGPHLLSDPLVVMVVWVFGAINLVTGVTGFCPVYKLAGIDTARD